MKARGFTLIELMIVACIIGILAAITIPAYQRYLCLHGNKKSCVPTSSNSQPVTQEAPSTDSSWTGHDICIHGVRYFQSYDTHVAPIVEIGPDGKPLTCQ